MSERSPASEAAAQSADVTDRAPAQVLLLAFALFLSYLTVAMALPVVSAYAVHALHFSNSLAGLAVGIAFLATIFTRSVAGTLSDDKGPRVCMQRGLLLYSAASLLCLASILSFPSVVRFGILLAGRLLLGVGESLVVVGMISWAIGLMGAHRSGKVMAWMGAGMYGAFAVGGPLGLALYDHGGFAATMLAAVLLPLLGMALVRSVPGVTPHAGKRESFWRIIGRIWRPGAAVALQGVGFAALGAFVSLYFQQRGWPYAGLGLTFFGVGFVLVRVLCGHLPDKIGGTPVAVVSLAVEAVGQFMLWNANGPMLALAGACLTGLGCSMVYPSLGAEVVKAVPPQLRGTAVGGFAAFQDMAYGATGPVAGLLADRVGYAVVFLFGAICAVLALVAAMSTVRIGGGRHHPSSAD